MGPLRLIRNRFFLNGYYGYLADSIPSSVRELARQLLHVPGPPLSGYCSPFEFCAPTRNPMMSAPEEGWLLDDIVLA